ncbi:MAG: undecaprenyldiphospho-muramoylpentapeptide beta-N-acetylglucosaminyltransferase [Cytophagaceae bacterium]
MAEKRPYRVIISGGGTGGHIYPAIAIANAIKEKQPDAEILFVGAKDRMEMEKVPAAGYKIEGLWISGIQRRLTIDNLLFPVKVLSSIWNASSIVRKFKPDVAVGVGGYASWPLLFSASLFNVPTVIQEQNSYAGVTNKFLAKNARKIFVAYDNMDKFFPGDKLVLAGNPVRKDILDYKSKRAEALKEFGLQDGVPVLMVMGGSLGARTINESILNDIKKITAAGIQVVWQTGKFYHQKVKAEAEKEGNAKIKVHEFLYKMDLAYAAADVVVSRAGALSISELCLVGKPVILVPSPNVAEDHQTKNALALVEKNAAIMIKDSESRAKLVDEALKLMKNDNKKRELGDNILKLGKPDAANTIASEILKLIKN